jgi:hypothetical protein
MDAVKLRVGAEVTLEGEMKPSELKVSRFTCGSQSVEIEHEKEHHHDHHGPADPSVASAMLFGRSEGADL